MSVSAFDSLAALVLSGEATEKQRMEFEEILKSSKEKQISFEKLKRVWHAEFRTTDDCYPKQKEYLWTRYQAERHFRNRKHQNFTKVAAVVLLLIAGGLSFYLLHKQNINTHQEDLVAVSEVVKVTKPGEKLKTQLPDGTVVHLNAGSRLTFPEHFADSVRLVQLSGEGYFEVSEDKSRPFTVRTQNMDITALGTAFDVNAYSTNLTDQVALVSGKLLIRNTENQEVKIDSGQTVTLSKINHVFSKSDLDYLAQVAWKDGVLYISHSSFDNIVQTLELYYGVHFTIDEPLKNSFQDTYTGTFKNESLDNILKILSFSIDFRYEIHGKEILIMKNKKTGHTR